MAGSLPEMPCGPILELSGQRKRFHVPFGLKPLMEQLIHQVLKDQPENIYENLACFMEARVQKKDAEERANRKSWEVHQWSWQGKSLLSKNSLDEFLRGFKTSLEEADRFAVVIQTAYRCHVAREKVKGLRNSKENEAGCSMMIEEKEQEVDEDENEEEPDLEESEYCEDDDENDNFAGDEDELDEDYSRTFDESEEEFETEMETISEMEDLAEENIEVLTVKPPASLAKYQMEQADSKTEVGLPQKNPEEEGEAEEKEDHQEE